jgi:4-amino-4-deoxy-L-arabinose transferase
MSLRVRVCWVLGIFVAVGLVGLGVRPMVQPDEPRYAIMAAEMLDTGAWTNLRMAGFHYYEKPPMGIWCTALSLEIFGRNAFAARLPSALAAFAMAALAGVMAARISGRREMGVAAFAVQATTVGPMVIGGVVTLDAMFAAWVTGSLVALHGTLSSFGAARARWLLMAGACCGMAVLTKGLLGWAIPAVAAGSFLVWERRWRELLWVPLPVLAQSLIVVLPVAWLIHRAEPRFWEYFITVEHLRRFSDPDSNQHREPWWWLIVLLPVGGVVWSLVWWQALQGVRSAVAWASGARFALAWIAAPLALLSLSAGKLPTYILPLYPAVSILVALGLVKAFESGLRPSTAARMTAQAALLIVAGAVVLSIFVGTAWGGLPERLWSEGTTLRLVAIAAALIVWALVDRWSWRSHCGTDWVLRSATAPVALLALVPFLFPDAAVRATQIPLAALRASEAVIRGSEVVASDHQMAHCVTWISGRRDQLVMGRAGEFDNELGLPQDQSRLVSVAQVIERLRGGGWKSFCIVTIPSDAQVILAAGGVAKPLHHEVCGDVVVLGW